MLLQAALTATVNIRPSYARSVTEGDASTGGTYKALYYRIKTALLNNGALEASPVGATCEVSVPCSPVAG